MKKEKLEDNEEMEEEVELDEESKETEPKAKVGRLELDFSMDPSERLQKEIDFTDSEYEKVVGNFLIGKFKKDRVLEECYLTRKITLKMIWGSIVAVAKKKAVSNAAVMADDEVFGLAIHYIQDGEIKESKQETYVLTKEVKKSLEEKAREEYLAEQKRKIEEEERKRIEREKKKLEEEKKRREESGQILLFSDLE